MMLRMSDEFIKKSNEIDKWYYLNDKFEYVPKEGTPEEIKILHEQLKKEYKKNRIE